MMWVDTSLAGLFSGVQAMVGTPGYLLALQSEGRKSVEQDWKVMPQFSDFRQGFTERIRKPYRQSELAEMLNRLLPGS